VRGKLPKAWQSETLWIDMLPGAEIELPGKLRFRLAVDICDGVHVMRLFYNYAGSDQTFTADLCTPLDLSVITGFPCVLIPRAIRPASSKEPAAVQLEFGRVMPQ